MPELPEVETIVRELRRKISGKKLSRFLPFDKKLKSPNFRLPSRVLRVGRRGKYIVFDLDCGRNCVIHLRMTGALLFQRRAEFKRRAEAEEGTTSPHSPIRTNGRMRDGHSTDWPSGWPSGHGARAGRYPRERARFYFSDGSILRFFDVRRFGTIEWPFADMRRHFGIPGLPPLGVEPLSRKFNQVALAKLLRNSGRAVKTFLLDQKKIAGIGNIYADESLWTAKIHPLRGADSLLPDEVRRLVLAIGKILREAIRRGGFTLRDYRRTGGESGYYQRSRKVYGREDRPCRRCRAKIIRIKLGGRSSYFCPKCQK